MICKGNVQAMLKRTRSHSQPIITMATRVWLQEMGNKYEPKRSKSEPRKPQVVSQSKRASPEDSPWAATPRQGRIFTFGLQTITRMILCLAQWSAINERSGNSTAKFRAGRPGLVRAACSRAVSCVWDDQAWSELLRACSRASPARLPGEGCRFQEKT